MSIICFLNLNSRETGIARVRRTFYFRIFECWAGNPEIIIFFGGVTLGGWVFSVDVTRGAFCLFYAPPCIPTIFQLKRNNGLNCEGKGREGSLF